MGALEGKRGLGEKRASVTGGVSGTGRAAGTGWASKGEDMESADIDFEKERERMGISGFLFLVRRDLKIYAMFLIFVRRKVFFSGSMLESSVKKSLLFNEDRMDSFFESRQNFCLIHLKRKRFSLAKEAFIVDTMVM